MLNSCRNSRIVGPSGIWEYEQLIGAKVKVSSLPVSNFFGCFSGGGSNDLLTNQSICGYGVDTEASWIKDMSNGIAFIDEKGNIITNRIVRIVGANVEDINTDTNEITDIDVNFNGDILDKR